jgi:outer membrane protein TolC
MAFARAQTLDSLKAPRVLTPTAYMDIVRKYHPVMKQARLMVQSAQAGVLASRGAFDPNFVLNNDQKRFNGENYYFHTNSELEIPTWYGIELYAGTENNGWGRNSADITLGQTSYAGISLPLLKDLLMDKRRAALQQSKIMQQQSEQELLLAMNNLLYDAMNAYWNWVKSYALYTILTNAVKVNSARYVLIKKSFEQGDRAAIDTTEALTQLQSFEYLQSQFLQDFRNNSYEVSNYLWLENNLPAVVDAATVPDSSWNLVGINNYPLPQLEQAKTVAATKHPKLNVLDFKAKGLEVERKLKFQSLLPKLDLKYNFLTKGYEPWKNIGQNLFDNNFKYGFGFSVPLLQRAARGEYKQSKFKIETNQLEISYTGLQLVNKVQATFNDIISHQRQVDILEKAYFNYQRLFRAEEAKFNLGESSLFLLNSRENKALEALEKLAEVKTKFFKSLVELEFAQGALR